ncbi:MAG: glycosyltransferase family 2 protein [Deltaproteobacteria bacterium]|nr:glycosyltransferase family 2 protein [Deltaproteobacteria bacterium]
MSETKMKISIICPIFNNSRSFPTLITEIRSQLETCSDRFEIILVDDRSSDDSWLKIGALASQNENIKGIRLSRNFGQQLAVSAGIRHASGDIIIIMDGDLQNPPEAIPKMVERIESGKDIVYTVSKVRNNWGDEITSRLFWFVMNTILKVEIIPNQLMMKAFSRKFVDLYNGYEERIRIVAGITHDIGMEYEVLEVINRKRPSGRGNYGFFKRFHLMLDVVITMTNRPLNYLINLSLFAVLISLGLGGYTLINYFLYTTVPKGYTTLIVIVSFFGSLTMLVLGIIGRYLSNIYSEVRQRPTFIVQNKLNLGEA